MVIHDSPATSRAAALRDRDGEDDAPQMIARGSRDIARQIVEIARECGIPIEGDGDLLNLLEQLDLGEEIPPELYTMVAEVLAFAYVVNGNGLDVQLRQNGVTSEASAGGDRTAGETLPKR